ISPADACSHATCLRMPASDMSSIWSYSSLRPRKVSWIGLNYSCSSYFSSNQAFRRAVSDCWSLVAAVAAAAAAVSGLAAGCLQATRANGRARARATARELRAKGGRTIGLSRTVVGALWAAKPMAAQADGHGRARGKPPALVNQAN